jgi:hypothetical protein
MAVRAANTIEQATKMVAKEVDREFRRAAESQSGTTINIGAMAISTSPESGPEGSAPLLPSLDDLPTLWEMLGLPSRESSPEEVDDDYDNGLRRLFWMLPDMENPPNGLRPSSPARSLRPPPQSLCPLPPPQSLCPLSPPQSLCPLPPLKSLCLLPPPQSLRSLPLPLPLP